MNNDELLAYADAVECSARLQPPPPPPLSVQLAYAVLCDHKDRFGFNIPPDRMLIQYLAADVFENWCAAQQR